MCAAVGTQSSSSSWPIAENWLVGKISPCPNWFSSQNDFQYLVGEIGKHVRLRSFLLCTVYVLPEAIFVVGMHSRFGWLIFTDWYAKAENSSATPTTGGSVKTGLELDAAAGSTRSGRGSSVR